MENINQLYDALLKRKKRSLEEEMEKENSRTASKLAASNSVFSSSFIISSFETNVTYMRRFVNYALSEFHRLSNSTEADIEELETTSRFWINSFFDKNLNGLHNTFKHNPLMNSIMTTDLEQAIKTRLEEVESEALENLKIAKAEKKFGLARVPLSQITIKDSAIGLVNVGNITGNIARNIIVLQNSGHKDVADSLRNLLDKVNEFKDEIGENYAELLSHLQFLTEEANKPQEQRNLAVVKSVFRYIPEVISLSSGLITIWEKFGPQIAAFFGLNIGG